jgi:hypothetical protein
VRGPPLPTREQRDDGETAEQRADDLRAAPADRVRADDGPGDAEQPGGGKSGTEDVEARATAESRNAIISAREATTSVQAGLQLRSAAALCPGTATAPLRVSGLIPGGAG